MTESNDAEVMPASEKERCVDTDSITDTAHMRDPTRGLVVVLGSARASVVASLVQQSGFGKRSVPNP